MDYARKSRSHLNVFIRPLVNSSPVFRYESELFNCVLVRLFVDGAKCLGGAIYEPVALSISILLLIIFIILLKAEIERLIMILKGSAEWAIASTHPLPGSSGHATHVAHIHFRTFWLPQIIQPLPSASTPPLLPAPATFLEALTGAALLANGFGGGGQGDAG